MSRISASLGSLSIDAINLADSPMACPRMSPLALEGAVRAHVGVGIEIIPHITVRDRNRVALKGMVWGAVATGTRVVLIVSGDPVHFSNEPDTRHVDDLTVPEMVRLTKEAGLVAGVVIDPSARRRAQELRKLEAKLDAGAAFVISQPIYTLSELEQFHAALESYQIPVILGILPLVSRRHAHFLNDRVPGISVPEDLLAELDVCGDDAGKIGLQAAVKMLRAAREQMAGVCIMPPFDRFHLVAELLDDSSSDSER